MRITSFLKDLDNNTIIRNPNNPSQFATVNISLDASKYAQDNQKVIDDARKRIYKGQSLIDDQVKTMLTGLGQNPGGFNV